MVKWLEVPQKIETIETKTIQASDALKVDWSGKSGEIILNIDGTIVPFSLKQLLYPLGAYWEELYEANRFDKIRDAITTYWGIIGEPKIHVDILHTAEEEIYLRSKITTSRFKEEKKIICKALVDGVNKSFEYTRVLVGTDGHRLELQFLNSTRRMEVRKGDFVDCGLFLSVNGRVRMSPGVNRLVCTNGLIEQMYLMDGQSEYEFTPDIIEKAAHLATWLSQQAEKKVSSIRELSAVLKNYPSNMLNRFWKSWSERCDLNELFYFDVIADLTASVNNTLSDARYRVLGVQEPINLGMASECRCPTCSATVS